MKKTAIEKFEELLTKSNITHQVAGDCGYAVDLEILGLHMRVTNANPINDEARKCLMVHVGYPKPAVLLSLIFMLKIIELKCTIEGITFEEIALEELDRRGLSNV